MAGRIVLYGATGYTGALTAKTMVDNGARPVLVGRDRARLRTLAEQLAQAGDGTQLETAVASSQRPGPLRDLIGPGDVLVSAAGPFLKVGRPAVEAAIDAGATTWTALVNPRSSVRCSRSSARGRSAPAPSC